MPTIPPDILERVVEDSVHRSGADRNDCRVLLARSVTWRDGSLGCPEPGKRYTMALVTGYWIVVEVQGRQFDYRVDRLGHLRLCMRPGSVDPLPEDVI